MKQLVRDLPLALPFEQGEDVGGAALASRQPARPALHL